MKSYTDIEQSKKLAEILPLESADLYYSYYHNPISGASYYEEYPIFHIPINKNKSLPCWSLAALLAFLPNSAFLERGSVTELYRITLPIELVPFDWFVEPVDACYELILKLHELGML